MQRSAHFVKKRGGAGGKGKLIMRSNSFFNDMNKE